MKFFEVPQVDGIHRNLSKQPFTFSIHSLLSKKTIHYVLIAHKIFFNLNAIQIARCCLLFNILKNLKTFRNSLRNCIETLRENDNASQIGHIVL